MVTNDHHSRTLKGSSCETSPGPPYRYLGIPPIFVRNWGTEPRICAVLIAMPSTRERPEILALLKPGELFEKWDALRADGWSS
jgi:hypothetical protein